MRGAGIFGKSLLGGYWLMGKRSGNWLKEDLQKGRGGELLIIIVSLWGMCSDQDSWGSYNTRKG